MGDYGGHDGNNIANGAVTLHRSGGTQPMAQVDPIKHLWATQARKADGGMDWRWSEYCEPEEETIQLDAKARESGMVHRHMLAKDPCTGGFQWKTASITIQGSELKQVLDVVLEDYPDLALAGRSTLKLQPPFKPMVSRWTKLLEYTASNIGPEMKMAGNTLIQAFEPLVGKAARRLSKIKEEELVAFHDLWLIFAPGVLVVTYSSGVEMVCRIIRAEPNKKDDKIFDLEMEYVEWNGGRFGLARKFVSIQKYDDGHPIRTLPVQPFWIHEDDPECRTRFIQRGQKFEEHRGFHHKICRGRRLVKEPQPNGVVRSIWKPVSGKVIVDAYAYYKCQDLTQEEMAPLRKPVSEEVSKSDSETKTGLNPSDKSRKVPKKRKAPGADTSSSQLPEERTETVDSLTDDERLLANPLVKGFDLASMEWCEFSVDEIDEIVWLENAFDKVVLSPTTRELVEASVNSKKAGISGFNDIVSNKGHGLIAVMFGPPGVGKTLTVEAVAEHTKSPLYLLSAGELGTEPATVEKKLSTTLECCKLWRAILLIDEADVFLTARSPKNMKQNELISIFLRRMEYYQGLMFLTTNRFEVIDLAFQSRIDIILPYKDLDQPARRQIWRNTISQIRNCAFEVGEEDLDQLAAISVNGREIKNLLKSAQMMALQRGTPVTGDMLQKLATMRLEAQRAFKH